jgi:stage V sporulation protein B
MNPTAISQVIEQMGKLILGLWLASYWVKRGVEFGAAGAMLGVTLSEVMALALLLGIYRRKKTEIRDNIKKNRFGRYRESTRSIMTRMMNIAVPVTIGASFMPLVALADEIIVVNRLVDVINYDTGLKYTVEEATRLYGLLTAYASPLINFPTIITIALAMSVVPSISESYVLKDWKAISYKAETAMRLTLLIGLPAAVGMSAMARPVIQLLYASLDAGEIAKAGNILSVLSIGIVFLTGIQTLTGILQGINRIVIPVRNLLIGALAKIGVSYILIGIPGLNVLGAAVGTVVCYLTASLLDFAAMVKHIGISQKFAVQASKFAFASGFMGAVVIIMFKPLMTAVGGIPATILAIFIGIIIYALALIVMGAVDAKDLRILFRNSKLADRIASIRLRNG